MKTTIGFIGGGRIAKIFLEGFKNKNVDFESVKVFDPNSETLDALANDYPSVKKAETPEEAAKAKSVDSGISIVQAGA
jgi:pyrroline-5-carboxylate reductase